MNLDRIKFLVADINEKGDLFCRLIGDLFYALGYNEPRFDVHKSGREVDLSAEHRTEKKTAIAECKAHKDTIGGSDINKFIGTLDAERKKIKKARKGSHDVIGYFVSLSGFKETAIEQENELDNDRVIMMGPKKIVNELIAGKVIVSIAKAVSSINSPLTDLELEEKVDLIAYKRGWVWALYFSNGQKITHYSLIHAEGKPLVKDLVDELISLDPELSKLTYLAPINPSKSSQSNLVEVQNKYFNYLKNECGEIQFEGLPTDKESGSAKIKLEDIFVPLYLENIDDVDEQKYDLTFSAQDQRQEVGNVLSKKARIAILAKPGGGKSTLIKRLAIAYAFPERRVLINDSLPDRNLLPIFIRCRELGDKVNNSITDIINSIPNRAEITYLSKEFSSLVSDTLQKGNALILIDGLDEISDERQRISFVNQLRTFLATYPEINIVVTSREAGFRAVSGVLSTYCSRYRLSPLNDEEILSLTVKWHKEIIDDSKSTLLEAESLVNVILNDYKINIIAQNPLLLTTLLFVKRWVGYLPTKRSVLYQEMIKLLLVTWNVEGYEQLDIDEAEPQLAYVAFWMTLNGQQTISANDLKACLLASRRQMPDILSFTRISVPDFIKRVESRSSLLIMSGHEQTVQGLIPIYEFLHLSFQEYLTAKAIVEKYLPDPETKKTELNILKAHVLNESWKEVIPLVAVLSRRRSKPLIDYLISQCKKYRNVDIEEHNEEEGIKLPKFVFNQLLGSCIANDIQISPDTLEEAIEWYAKGYSTDDEYANVIINSKFSQLFSQKVYSLFFKEYNDVFTLSLLELILEIYHPKYDDESLIITYNKLVQKLNSSGLEDKTIALLSLMQFSFDITQENLFLHLDSSTIFDELMLLLQSNKQQIEFVVYWATVWLTKAEILKLTTNQLNIYLNIIINKWLFEKKGKLSRFSGWAIEELINQEIKIDQAKYSTETLKLRILEIFNNPRNDQDKATASFLGINLGIDWNKDQLEQIKNIIMIKYNSVQDPILFQYANTLGIVLDEPDEMPDRFKKQAVSD